MDITSAEIDKIFQVGSAAVGGGVVYKLLDIIIGRRRRKVDTDGQVTKQALDFVKALNEDIERLKKDVAQANEERVLCTKNYDEQRLLITDLKISLRSIYEYMVQHKGKCPAFVEEEIPDLAKNLK